MTCNQVGIEKNELKKMLILCIQREDEELQSEIRKIRQQSNVLIRYYFLENYRFVCIYQPFKASKSPLNELSP
jgi:hypothetical protein